MNLLNKVLGIVIGICVEHQKNVADFYPMPFQRGVPQNGPPCAFCLAIIPTFAQISWNLVKYMKQEKKFSYPKEVVFLNFLQNKLKAIEFLGGPFFT